MRVYEVLLLEAKTSRPSPAHVTLVGLNKPETFLSSKFVLGLRMKDLLLVYGV